MTPVQLGTNDRLALAFFHALGLEQPFAWFWHPIVPKSRRKCAASSEIHVCVWQLVLIMLIAKDYLQHYVVDSIATITLKMSLVATSWSSCNLHLTRIRGPRRVHCLWNHWAVQLASLENVSDIDNLRNIQTFKRNIANSESESSKLSPGWFPDIIARVAFFQNWNEWLDWNQLCQLKKTSMDWTVKERFCPSSITLLAYVGIASDLTKFGQDSAGTLDQRHILPTGVVIFVDDFRHFFTMCSSL